MNNRKMPQPNNLRTAVIASMLSGFITALLCLVFIILLDPFGTAPEAQQPHDPYPKWVTQVLNNNHYFVHDLERARKVPNDCDAHPYKVFSFRATNFEDEIVVGVVCFEDFETYSITLTDDKKFP